MSARIVNGIEWTLIDWERGEDCQCARCGSSADFVRCWNCGGEGVDGHDCGEDICCCRYPEDNVVCDICRGTGGGWHCVSTPEYCESHPLPGRDGILSTALSPNEWVEA